MFSPIKKYTFNNQFNNPFLLDYYKFLNAKTQLHSISNRPIYHSNNNKLEISNNEYQELKAKSLNNSINLIVEIIQTPIFNYYLNKKHEAFYDKLQNSSKFETYENHKEMCQTNQKKNQINRACETSKFFLNSELSLGKININESAHIKDMKTTKSFFKKKKYPNLSNNILTHYGSHRFRDDQIQKKATNKKININHEDNYPCTPGFKMIKFKNIPKGLLVNFKIFPYYSDEKSNFHINGEKIHSSSKKNPKSFSKRGACRYHPLKNKFLKHVE